MRRPRQRWRIDARAAREGLRDGFAKGPCLWPKKSCPLIPARPKGRIEAFSRFFDAEIPCCNKDAPFAASSRAQIAATGGEAHIARPRNCSELGDEAWAFLYGRSNPRGMHADGGVTCMAAGASSMRCATRRMTASPRPRSARNIQRLPNPGGAPRDAGSMSTTPFRLDGGIDRTRKLRFFRQGLRRLHQRHARFRPLLRQRPTSHWTLVQPPPSWRPSMTSPIPSWQWGRAYTLTPISRYPGGASVTASGAEPEPLALAQPRLRRSRRRVLSRSFPPASTTRRSCGRNRPGNAFTSRRSAPWPAWARADPPRCRHLRATLCRLRCAHHRGWSGRHRGRARGRSHGARVILCDEQAELGGSLLAETKAMIDGKEASAWLADAVWTLTSSPNVRWLSRTTAFGYFPHDVLASPRLTEKAPARRSRASGSGKCAPSKWCSRDRHLERPLVFPDNDRPGIMLADAARGSLARYAVKPGSRGRGDRP